MSSNQEPTRILAPESFRRALSRRTLFQMGGAAAGHGHPRGLRRRQEGRPRGHGGTTAGGTTAGTTAPAPVARQQRGASDVGDSGTGLGVATGDYSRVTNKSSGSFNMYTWGAYNDPDIVGALAEKDLGVKMQVSYYTSNEDLITKLQASKGTSGFDIVVPTGPYIPQMIQNGLLEKFDKSKLPNMVNVDPQVPRPGVGPDQRLQRLQGLGLDRLVLRQDEDQDRDQDLDRLHRRVPGRGQQELLGARHGGKHGRHVLLGQRHRLEHREEGGSRCVREVPRRRVRHAHQGVRQLPVRQDRRGRLHRVDDVERRRPCGLSEDLRRRRQPRRLGVGSRRARQPSCGWTTTASLPAAPNPDAAHAWINWILIPEVSIKDLDFHGYNSGMMHMERPAQGAQARPEVRRHDLLQGRGGRRRCGPRRSRSALDRLVDIINKVKAAAGA